MNIEEISIGVGEGGQGTAGFRRESSELLCVGKALLNQGQRDSIRYKGA